MLRKAFRSTLSRFTLKAVQNTSILNAEIAASTPPHSLHNFKLSLNFAFELISLSIDKSCISQLNLVLKIDIAPVYGMPCTVSVHSKPH